MGQISSYARLADAFPQRLRRTFPAEHTIWHTELQSSVMSHIRSGFVKLIRRSASGEETLLQIVGPGEILCGYRPYCGGCYCCCAVTLTEVALSSVPRRVLLDAIDCDAGFARAFLDQTLTQSVKACARLEQFGYGHAEYHVAMLLSDLARRVGKRTERGVELALRLRRKDIANYCGTTVETAIRALSALRKRGLVREDDKKITIVRLDELANISPLRHRADREDEAATGSPADGLAGDRRRR
ncbi:MAG: Crp/Fnr family transcriptional regulator [Deltaproteobacteria bacterium]|nr:Crp/Fnr family transcriptional regulator [Deltaproteobacteria bacterium]